MTIYLTFPFILSFVIASSKPVASQIAPCAWNSRVLREIYSNVTRGVPSRTVISRGLRDYRHWHPQCYVCVSPKKEDYDPARKFWKSVETPVQKALRLRASKPF